MPRKRQAAVPDDAPEARERRREQNRVAQRNYRERMRERLTRAENYMINATAVPARSFSSFAPMAGGYIHNISSFTVESPKYSLTGHDVYHDVQSIGLEFDGRDAMEGPSTLEFNLDLSISDTTVQRCGETVCAAAQSDWTGQDVSEGNLSPCSQEGSHTIACHGVSLDDKKTIVEPQVAGMDAPPPKAASTTAAPEPVSTITTPEVTSATAAELGVASTVTPQEMTSATAVQESAAAATSSNDVAAELDVYAEFSYVEDFLQEAMSSDWSIISDSATPTIVPDSNSAQQSTAESPSTSLGATNQARSSLLSPLLESPQAVEQTSVSTAYAIELDEDDNTPLLTAAANGHVQMVRLLRVSGADLEVKTKSGKTSLQVATEREHIEVVSALLDMGADRNITDTSGFGLLHRAVIVDNVELLSTLLKAMTVPIINMLDSKSRSALYLAAELGRHKCISALVDSGADANLLHKAVAEGDINLINGLLEVYGTSKGSCKDLVNMKDSKGKSPLWLAARLGKFEIAKLLIVFGAEVN